MDTEFIEMLKPLKDEFRIFNRYSVKYPDLVVDCETDCVGIYLRQVSSVEYEYLRFSGNTEVAEYSYLLRIPKVSEIVSTIGWSEFERFSEFVKVPYITLDEEQMKPKDLITSSEFEFEKLLVMFLMKIKKNKRWNGYSWV